MSECLTDRIDLYLESLPPPTGRTFHQMQPETLLSECRNTINLQSNVIVGYQNDLWKLEKAYAQQQQVWADAIARADRYEAALLKICDGPRDADKSYPELFAEVCWEARAALAGEKKDE